MTRYLNDVPRRALTQEQGSRNGTVHLSKDSIWDGGRWGEQINFNPVCLPDRWFYQKGRAKIHQDFDRLAREEQESDTWVEVTCTECLVWWENKFAVEHFPQCALAQSVCTANAPHITAGFICLYCHKACECVDIELIRAAERAWLLELIEGN